MVANIYHPYNFRGFDVEKFAAALLSNADLRDEYLEGGDGSAVWRAVALDSNQIESFGGYEAHPDHPHPRWQYGIDVFESQSNTTVSFRVGLDHEAECCHVYRVTDSGQHVVQIDAVAWKRPDGSPLSATALSTKIVDAVCGDPVLGLIGNPSACDLHPTAVQGFSAHEADIIFRKLEAANAHCEAAVFQAKRYDDTHLNTLAEEALAVIRAPGFGNRGLTPENSAQFDALREETHLAWLRQLARARQLGDGDLSRKEFLTACVMEVAMAADAAGELRRGRDPDYLGLSFENTSQSGREVLNIRQHGVTIGYLFPGDTGTRTEAMQALDLAAGSRTLSVADIQENFGEETTSYLAGRDRCLFRLGAWSEPVADLAGDVWRVTRSSSDQSARYYAMRDEAFSDPDVRTNCVHPAHRYMLRTEDIPEVRLKAMLPVKKVVDILQTFEETAAQEYISYYASLDALAGTVRGSKNWSMGQIFVCPLPDQRYVIMKQVAPASCEMMTITQNGFHDVLTAYRYEQAELVKVLTCCSGTSASPSLEPVVEAVVQVGSQDLAKTSRTGAEDTPAP